MQPLWSLTLTELDKSRPTSATGCIFEDPVSNIIHDASHEVAVRDAQYLCGLLDLISLGDNPPELNEAPFRASATIDPTTVMSLELSRPWDREL